MCTAGHEARQRDRDLADLRYHWGEAYAISWQSGQFRAARRDTGAAVLTSTAAGLRAEILADYRAMPVPRDAMK
jgi:hypothetical protein